MPAPTSYTEVTLAQFMHNEVLALVAPLLDLNLTGNGGVGTYGETVNETVLAYHGNATGTIAEATNIIKLRALARREAWKMASGRAVSLYDAASEEQQEKLSQVHTQALKQIEMAEDAVEAAITPATTKAGPSQSTAVRTEVQW